MNTTVSGAFFLETLENVFNMGWTVFQRTQICIFYLWCTLEDRLREQVDNAYFAVFLHYSAQTIFLFIGVLAI